MIIDNDLGYVYDDMLKPWSKEAIHCYSVGCVCSKCDIPHLRELKVKCRMKAYVLELVKKFGAPKECKNKFTSIEAT